MKIKQHKNTCRQVKDIAMGSSLLLSLVGGVSVLQSCASSQTITQNKSNDAAIGIKSYIKEFSLGNFKITNEEKTTLDSTVAFVEYLDGKRDTLNLNEAKVSINEYLKTHEDEIGRNNSLGNVLLFGGIGTVLANQSSDNIYLYSREKYGNNSFQEAADSTSNNWNEPFETNPIGGNYFYFYSRFYFSPQIYRRCRALHERSGARYVFSSPRSSSSGHFSYSHSSTGG